MTAILLILHLLGLRAGDGDTELLGPQEGGPHEGPLSHHHLVLGEVPKVSYVMFFLNIIHASTFLISDARLCRTLTLARDSIIFGIPVYQGRIWFIVER